MKRVAIGAAVVGAFVAGAAAGVNRNKMKAFAKKTGRSLKSKMRGARSAAANKAADVRELVNDRIIDVRQRAAGVRKRVTNS